MSKKELAVQEEQELAIFGNERPDYVTDTSRGSEQVSSDDMSLPRLTIIQDLSPQRKKSNDEYIEGAEEGMIFNTANNQLFKKPVVIVPCFFRSEFVAWKDRNAGGGFGGAFGTEEEAEDYISAQENPAAWEVQYTHQHFCVLVHPHHTAEKPALEDVVLSMSRSQLKPSRKWNTVIQTSGGDRFSRAYRLSVVSDRSDKGEFYNWKMDQLGFVPKEIFDRAEQVYEAVKSGTVDVSRKVDNAPERHDDNDM